MYNLLFFSTLCFWSYERDSRWAAPVRSSWRAITTSSTCITSLAVDSTRTSCARPRGRRVVISSIVPDQHKVIISTNRIIWSGKFARNHKFAVIVNYRNSDNHKLKPACGRVRPRVAVACNRCRRMTPRNGSKSTSCRAGRRRLFAPVNMEMANCREEYAQFRTRASVR